MRNETIYVKAHRLPAGGYRLLTKSLATALKPLKVQKFSTWKSASYGTLHVFEGGDALVFAHQHKGVIHATHLRQLLKAIDDKFVDIQQDENGITLLHTGYRDGDTWKFAGRARFPFVKPRPCRRSTIKRVEFVCQTSTNNSPLQNGEGA